MPINDIYRATFASRVNNVNVANVMHFRQIDDEGAEVAADSLKAALESVLLPTWVPMLSNEVIIDSVAITQIEAVEGQPFVYSLAAGTGTVAQHAEPPNLAVVLSIYSDDNSRAGRGRVYLAGIAQTLIQGAVPKASFVSLCATFTTTLVSAMIHAPSTIHWTMVQWSGANDSYNPIVHVEQRMQLRTLRKRNRN